MVKNNTPFPIPELFRLRPMENFVPHLWCKLTLLELLSDKKRFQEVQVCSSSILDDFLNTSAGVARFRRLFEKSSTIDRLEFKNEIIRSSTQMRIIKETLSSACIKEVAFTDLPNFNSNIAWVNDATNFCNIFFQCSNIKYPWNDPLSTTCHDNWNDGPILHSKCYDTLVLFVHAKYYFSDFFLSEAVMAKSKFTKWRR